MVGWPNPHCTPACAIKLPRRPVVETKIGSRRHPDAPVARFRDVSLASDGGQDGEAQLEPQRVERGRSRSRIDCVERVGA